MRKIGFILLFLPIFALAQTEQSQDEKQLYNMSFDEWSKRRGAWFPQPEDAKGREKDWDSANKGLSFIGLNGTTPEYEHVAVKGDGLLIFSFGPSVSLLSRSLALPTRIH